jgi:hypothetical protein
MGPVPEFINLFLHLRLRKMWIVSSLRSAFFLFIPRRGAAGGVCATPTPKKMYPSSSRLLGEVWKNLDEIFGSQFSP